MSNEAIRPSTIDGIKRLAKALKVERGIKHTQALDAAAHAAGFKNYPHAANVLRSDTKADRSHPGHRVFLTSYWKDLEHGKTGRETLSIFLSVPWGVLITAHQLRNHRALQAFRAEGPDHLARELMTLSQSSARSSVCAAARALHFMDATKLRPSASITGPYPRELLSNWVPGGDHHSIWYDRQTKRYLLVDEPYEKAVEGIKHQREAWAKKYGFVIAKPEWPGIYAPDIGSRLYLIANEKNGIPLEPLVAALNKLPSTVVTAWDGDSAPIGPFFVSPGTIAKTSCAKDRAKTPSKQHGQPNSVGYIMDFVGPQRRPNGRIPIEVHAHIGRLLKSVLKDTYQRKGVYNRLNAIRSELEEWLKREYNQAELPNEKFSDLYYHESVSPFVRALVEADRERHVQSLVHAKKLLAKHYPDCAPLRSLLKRVDAAVSSLRVWN